MYLLSWRRKRVTFVVMLVLIVVMVVVLTRCLSRTIPDIWSLPYPPRCAGSVSRCAGSVSANNQTSLFDVDEELASCVKGHRRCQVVYREVVIDYLIAWLAHRSVAVSFSRRDTPYNIYIYMFGSVVEPLLYPNRPSMSCKYLYIYINQVKCAVFHYMYCLFSYLCHYCISFLCY